MVNIFEEKKMTDSMIQYKTVFESTKSLPMPIVVGHGENADLVASIRDGGVDVDLEGYTARAIYQPKSKWDTDEWFECPCEIVDNAVVAHWGNLYDNGDNAVRLFLHLSKDGVVAYPAIYHIRLFETPGFSPNPLTPIPETIDFSQYTLLNAPWVPLAGNETITGDLTMDECDIKHKSAESVTYKNLELLNDTQERYEGDMAMSYRVEDASKLLDWDSGEIAVKFSGKLVSTGEIEEFEATLKNPDTYYVDGVGVQAYWEIYRDDAFIGDVIFRAVAGDEYPITSTGYVYGEVWIGCEYQQDTTATVEETSQYVYDTGNLVDEAELENALDYRITTGNMVRHRHLLEVGEASGDISLYFVTPPDNEKIFDAIADVTNAGEDDMTVSFVDTVGAWAFAVDDGVDFDEMRTLAPGVHARFYFTQTGFNFNGKLVLSITRKDIKFVEE